MSQKSDSTPEARLAEALVTAVNEGADFSKTIEQIPKENRSKISDAISGGNEISKTAVIVPNSKEVQEAIKSLNLEEDFEKAMETQSFFELPESGQKTPDFGQVLKTFTPEMLAIAQDFQSPTLTLTTKGRSFEDLVSAMDGHKTMPNQQDVYADNLYSVYTGSPFRYYAGQKPEAWGAYIIEAPTETEAHEFDNTDLVLRKRLEEFTKYKEANGVSGMDRWKYIHLMMQKIKDGEPIDVDLCTMLDEDPALSDSRVLVADLSSRVSFDWLYPDDGSDGARFRRSVGGVVPPA